MEKAMQYLDLIRKDPFLHAMLASYDNAAAAQVQDCVLDYGCGYGWVHLDQLQVSRHRAFDRDKKLVTAAGICPGMFFVPASVGPGGSGGTMLRQAQG